MEVLEVECLKIEPVWESESTVSEHALLEDLYADHKVKHELVIGPELLQVQQPAPRTIEVTVKIENGETCEEELLNCNEKPDIGVKTPLPTNKYPKSIGEDTGKHYFSQKELFKLQNCFVKIERMIFHKERYICKTCGKTFSRRSSRTHHIMHSHEKKKTTAKKEIFNAPAKHATKAAKIHVSNTILKNCGVEKPHKCDFCMKQFKLKFQLENHERTHTGEKPYSCRICSRGFSEQSNLRKHERSHTGERPFSCEICKRQFALKCNLMGHIRTHTKERPYSCNLCCNQFRDHSTFKRHILLHTKPKLFICDICNHQFARKYYLIRHIRIHTKKKLYTCEICSKQFENKCNLRAHKKQHKEHYLCEICDKQFYRVFTLKRHLLSHMASPALL